MKILHIPYWYPSKKDPHWAIFVKEHVDALNLCCYNEVVHIHIFKSKKLFDIRIGDSSNYEKFIFIYTVLNKFYFIEEFFSFVILLYLFTLKKKHKHFDVINFHIATPLCRYLKIVKKITKKPIVITEHSSGYYYNYGLNRNHYKLDRIKNIFQTNPLLVTVSHALGKEIQAFSGQKNLSFEVIPNVADKDTFSLREKEVVQKLFFMVTNWNITKDPFPVLTAFKHFSESYPEYKLVIAGDGPILSKMMNHAKDTDNISFIGRISKQQIAEYMNKAVAFLHNSPYETFSVVTAEAICCGCPVVVSNIPAIAEFINESNGIMVEQATKENWEKSLIQSIKSTYDRQSISDFAKSRFSKEVVGNKYFEVLSKYRVECTEMVNEK